MSEGLAPSFLIAVPQLLDPNFHMSVVLLLQQSDEGALGVVINQESNLLLSDLCRDHKIPYAGDPDKRVRRGGPVQPDHGLVLYGDEHRDEEGREVFRGLHVSASRGTLGRLCDLPRGRFFCYAGYAGWGPGQLEREIAEGSWVVGSPEVATVFDLSPDRMWDHSLRLQGIDPTALVYDSAGEA